MPSVRITKLHFYPGNARRGDIDLIADSLRVNGQYKPIVVNKGTKAPDLANTILAGNHTVMAAQRLGWQDIDVHYVDLDAEACKRVVLVDNRSNDVSTYDVEELLNLATDLPSLDGTGFTQDAIDAMLEAGENTTDELLDEAAGDPPADTYDLTVMCETAGQRDMLKARLVSEGFTVS